MSKIDIPDGGQYRVENEEKNKIRVYYDKRVDGFSLGQTVVKVPAEIQTLSEDGLTQLVNSMIHVDKVVACPFCEEVTPMSEMKGYSYAGSICQTCWRNCSCRQCGEDEWNHKSSRSTRKSNKKTCPHCGQSLITKVATG